MRHGSRGNMGLVHWRQFTKEDVWQIHTLNVCSNCGEQLPLEIAYSHDKPPAVIVARLPVMSRIKINCLTRQPRMGR